MIKWGEFLEGDFLFEAFLPEHEGQPQDWLLRVSRRGHIVEEHRIDLVWPPRFGPDAGDVASLERALDAALARVRELKRLESVGTYEPGPAKAIDPDPYVHAVLHSLLTDYVAAEAALQLTAEQSASCLDLDLGLQSDGLFPMAITPRRDARMRRIVLLARLAGREEQLRPAIPELVVAAIRDDVAAIGNILGRLGIALGPSAR